ncbi:trypsin-like peptidase domain-containing protein [Candidatus Microgenomates bacterium]|nr:trypsin-like peptidase domain-containing protein [Candidatus Microgenomates bacterium]
MPAKKDNLNKAAATTPPPAAPPPVKPGKLVVLVVSLVGGIIGGLIGIFFVNDYFSLSRDRARQVVLEESSAIIDVAKKVGPSVVSIVTEQRQVDVFGRSSTESGAGSGIIIRGDGLILTNKHVVPEGVNKITVLTNDNKELEAQVLARDPFNDLAYLQVQATDLAAAELGDSDQVVVGQRVIAIGNALGEFENTVTSGIISGIGRPVTATTGISEAERLQDLFQTDAAINPGNSGGPLVNIHGQVVGINTAIAGGAENIGFAIPINQAKAGIASIEKTGKLEKPYLGVRYVDINNEIAKANNLPVKEGALISSDEGSTAILPNSPAAKAGLKEGDIITKVNGEQITKSKSLVTLIGKFQVGDEISFTILRDGKSQEVKATLEALPQN